MQIQEYPFHFLIRSLKTFKFFNGFYLVRQIIPIFGPKLSKFLVPKATCLFLGVFELSLFCSLTSLEHNISSRISFIKLELKLFRDLYISMQSLCFLLNPWKINWIFPRFFCRARVIAKHESQCSFIKFLILVRNVELTNIHTRVQQLKFDATNLFIRTFLS